MCSGEAAEAIINALLCVMYVGLSFGMVSSVFMFQVVLCDFQNIKVSVYGISVLVHCLSYKQLSSKCRFRDYNYHVVKD